MPRVIRICGAIGPRQVPDTDAGERITAGSRKQATGRIESGAKRVSRESAGAVEDLDIVHASSRGVVAAGTERRYVHPGETRSEVKRVAAILRSAVGGDAGGPVTVGRTVPQEPAVDIANALNRDPAVRQGGDARAEGINAVELQRELAGKYLVRRRVSWTRKTNLPAVSAQSVISIPGLPPSIVPRRLKRMRPV